MLPGAARKAALLLTALDSLTAAELLKSVAPEMVTAIAAELAFIQRSGVESQNVETVREFATLLSTKRPVSEDNGFLREVLQNALGSARGEEAMTQVAGLLESRDPFNAIRSASIDDIAKTLEGESPQVAALVLSELPSKKSGQLLPLLDEKVRAGAIRGLTSGQGVSDSARLKVANVIRARLDEMAAKIAAAAKAGVSIAPTTKVDKRPQQLRKVALLLRGLEITLRTSLLASLSEQDSATAKEVQKYMIVWEDLPRIEDRAMQQVLRTVDSRKLALALIGGDPITASKIRSNISQRASAMLDEETSLLGKPKPEDIESSREIILNALREMNGKGELSMEGL